MHNLDFWGGGLGINCYMQARQDLFQDVRSAAAKDTLAYSLPPNFTSE
jgi:hypothetical protein